MRVITDEELDVLNQAILTRYGLDFYNYEKISFKRRISRVMYKFELDSVYDLWKKILYESDFITQFVNELTVGLTELFRNPFLWKYIRDEIVPEFDHQRPLRIWHAGCSSGEEVYSMSIVLAESERLHFSQSLATDINSRAVTEAREGFFSHEIIPKYTQNYQSFTSSGRQLDHYYHEVEGGIIFKEFLKNTISFQVGNLSQSHHDQEFDLIFCRNVLIYFDEVLKQRVLERFHNCLSERGYLILGYYDVLTPSQNQFFEMFAPTYKILTKSRGL